MAGKKISELTALGAAFATTDLFEISDDGGGGSYTSKSITGANISAGVYSVIGGATTNKLGIGIAVPAKNLHIYGASGEVELRIQSDTSYASIVEKDNAELIIQNAASGGVMIFHDDTAERMRIDTDGKVGIGTNAPKTALSVVSDYNTTTFGSQLTAGEGGGRILKYSPGGDDTLTVGQLYFLDTGGTWESCDASAVASGGSQILGVGLGNARSVGVLMEGFVSIPSTEILHTPGAGAVDGLPVYVSETAGHFDFDAPTTASAFVRIVGFAIDDDGGDVLVYFNPDNTWVELA